MQVFYLLSSKSRSAEVAIGSGGSIDRVSEIEETDDTARREVERLFYPFEKEGF
jgi:hypothetical protein